MKDLIPELKGHLSGSGEIGGQSVKEAARGVVRKYANAMKDATADFKCATMGLIETNSNKKIMYLREALPGRSAMGMKWEESREACKRLGGDLACDLTREDFDCLKGVLVFSLDDGID